jgi:hypothetical protein
MRRMSLPLPTRSRPGRARRRVLFFAESLESRQLLSAAAAHPTMPPMANVPALIGPAVASPVANANAATPQSTVATAFQNPVVLELGQVTVNFGNGASVTEDVFLVEGFSSPVTAAPSPAPVSSPAQPTNPVLPNPTSGAGNSSSSPASTPAITPLTATVLAGPGATNRAPVIVVVMPQTLVSLTPSTIPVTTQAILATAMQEEQPLPPPVLGQGFESAWTQSSMYRPELLPEQPPAPIKPQAPATDYVEPYEAPPPQNPAPSEPAQPAAPPQDALESELLDSIVVDPNRHAERSDAVPLPAAVPGIGATTHEESPSFSLAALVGAAAVASGGYRLVLGRSNRFNQRWLPTRRSSRRSKD